MSPRDPRFPSIHAPQYSSGMDVFGERSEPNPTNPQAGPFIGRSETVKRGQRVNVGRFNVLNREALPTMITLVRRDAKAANAQADSEQLEAPLVAHITVGAGAETDTFSCDWVNGMVLALPVASFQIDCEYPALNLAASANVDQSVGVMVSMGQPGGGRGIRPHARFSQRLGVVAAGGGNAAALVPAHAESVQLLTDRPDDYGSYSIQFQSSANLLLRSRTWSTQYPATDGEVLIPNGARSVFIENFALAAADLTIVYGLSV